MAKQGRYPQELRERAVRMVQEHRIQPADRAGNTPVFEIAPPRQGSRAPWLRSSIA